MNKRNQNLEFKLKLYFFFLPFGGEWFITNSTRSGILTEFKRRGAEKQFKEGVKYSISGLVFYSTLLIYFMTILL